MARNKGIEVSSGKYVCFLDADDTYTESYISQMVKALKDNKCELVVCGYSEGEKKWRYTSPGLYEGENLGERVFEFAKNQQLFNPCWNKLFLKSVIEANDVEFPIGIEMGEDAEFVLRYMTSISSFLILDQLLYVYSVSETSVTSKPFKTRWAFYQERRYFLWDEYFQRMNLDRMELNYYIVVQMLRVGARVAGANPVGPAIKTCKEIFWRPRMRQAAIELKGTSKDFIIPRIVRAKCVGIYILICMLLGVARKIKHAI